jgi:hypothetical protein
MVTYALPFDLRPAAGRRWLEARGLARLARHRRVRRVPEGQAPP